MPRYQNSHSPEYIRNDIYSYGQTNSGGDIKGLFIALAVICLVVSALAILSLETAKHETGSVSNQQSDTQLSPDLTNIPDASKF